MDRIDAENARSNGADATSNRAAAVPQPEFRAVYYDVAPLLRYLAIQRCAVPPEDAEGLVHDVFATYLRMRDRVRGDARTYLVAAIYRASRRYWHRRRGEEALTDDVAAERACGATDDAVALRLALASMLARLSPRCREAFRRYYLEEEPTEAIASAMKTSPGNVRYILHGCRKRARSIFEQITRVPDAGAF
jgi:RNA polymerase sigma factor (sigma-70 family)